VKHTELVDGLIVALSDPSDDVTAAAIGSLEHLRSTLPDFQKLLAELNEEHR
jgi:hypothetical protein